MLQYITFSCMWMWTQFWFWLPFKTFFCDWKYIVESRVSDTKTWRNLKMFFSQSGIKMLSEMSKAFFLNWLRTLGVRQSIKCKFLTDFVLYLFKSNTRPQTGPVTDRCLSLCSCSTGRRAVCRSFQSLFTEETKTDDPSHHRNIFSVSCINPLTHTIRDVHNLECLAQPKGRSVSCCDA